MAKEGGLRTATVLLMSLMFVASTAWAETETPQTNSKVPSVKKKDDTGGSTTITKTEKKDPRFNRSRFPVGGFITYENLMGLGTITSPDYAKKWEMSLDIAPRFYIFDNLYIQARLILSKEITVSSQSTSTKKQQLLLSDTILTFRYNDIYTIPKALISITPYVDFLFPTSLASQHTDLYLSGRVGLILKRIFKLGSTKLTLSYGFRFQKNFHKYTTSNITAGTQNIPTSSLLLNPELSNSALVAGGNNVSFSVLNRLTASYSFLKRFYVMLDFYVINSWTYSSMPKDDLSSEFAKAGRGQRDSMFGAFEFGVNVFEGKILRSIDLALGVSTLQPVFTSDGRHLRFPFFDFVSSPSNNTSIYFDVSMSF